LVSAQNRKRIYWTNIGLEPSGLFGDLESIITQPKDQGILLKDVLETEVDEKYFLSGKAINYIHRDKRNLAFQMNEDDEKSGCITAVFHKQIPYNQIIIHNTMPRSSTSGKGGTGHLSRNDGKTYCLDTGNTNAVEIKYQKEIEKSLSNEKATTIDASYYKGFGVRSGACRQVVKQISTNNKSNGGTQPYQQDRIYDINGISPALQAQLPNGSTMINTSRIRRLTPIECERLQTVADNYTNHVSDSQRYKMLGNGWTIDVIAHILKFAKF
jgi:DNA (cytosine-5)-methyltransferase 3A